MANHALRLSRRRFIASVGAAMTLPNIVPASALGRSGTVAPSNRTVLGAIGIGGRGYGDLRSFLGNADVQFVAICDVRAERRDAVKKLADSHYANSDCLTYGNMHEILARPDIDAVLIATGDRWHTMASITAAKAGNTNRTKHRSVAGCDHPTASKC